MKRSRDIPPVRLSLDDDIIPITFKKTKKNCPNPKCNHSSLDKIIPIDEKYLTGKVSEYTIDDLIYFGEKYHCKLYQKVGNLNLEVAAKLIEPLKELQDMVGITETKNDVAEKLISMLDSENHKTDMLHTVVFGPPGVGKTTFSRIIPKIYEALGRAKSSTVHFVKVKDLMGEYCGQTQPKVEKAFEKARGGTLIIDEAYSLGNKEKRNVFTEEMINAINQNLDLFRDVNVTFLGYEKPMMENFFSYNEGLFRRISFVFRLGNYKSNDLTEMLYRKLQKEKFNINMERDKVEEIIKNNEKEFPYFGGDIETLVSKIIISTNNRTLFMKKKDRKNIYEEDLMGGIEKLKKIRLEKKDKNEPPPMGMYN